MKAIPNGLPPILDIQPPPAAERTHIPPPTEDIIPAVPAGEPSAAIGAVGFMAAPGDGPDATAAPTAEPSSPTLPGDIAVAVRTAEMPESRELPTAPANHTHFAARAIAEVGVLSHPPSRSGDPVPDEDGLRFRSPARDPGELDDIAGGHRLHGYGDGANIAAAAEVQSIGASETGSDDSSVLDLVRAVESAGTRLAAEIDGRYSMLDTGLAAMALAQAEPTLSVASGERPLLAYGIRSGAVTGDGKYVAVDATARDGDGATLLAQLTALGLQQGASFGNMAGGLLPVARIAELADIANLAFASEALSMTHAGAVTSQGDHAMASDTARADYAVSGTGIKVGVISDSMNALGGLATDKSTGDLPSSTTILRDYTGGDATDEGRAMAQIVHDVAPGASILFDTAYASQAEFASAIISLANAGAKVIVDDVLYFAEPAYQDGIIAQAVNQVVNDQGVVYFSAAANDGNNGFESSFINSGVHETVLGRSETFAKLSSTAGMTQFLSVSMPSDTGAYFILDWAQPYASASPGKAATSDLDLFIYDSGGTALSTIDHFTGLGEQPYAIANNVGNDPKEVVFFYNDEATTQVVNLAVGLHSGSYPAAFKLMVLDNGGGVYVSPSTLNQNDGTIYGHAAAEQAIPVGAVGYFDTPPYGWSTPYLEDFSSEGPTTIYYDEAGNRLATPEVRETPFFTAPDGVSTTVPDFSAFYGTSAAAPHAAAVAALMLQANSKLNAEDIKHLLQDSAIDMDDRSTTGFDTGFDNASGSGFISADVAVRAAKTGIIDTMYSQPVVVGTHLNDTIAAGRGYHSIDGGAGIDTLDYSSLADSVTIDVAAGTAQGAPSASFDDTFTNLESYKGGSADDTLLGGSGADILAGGAGKDTLTGRGGGDTFVFGPGDSAIGARDLITDFTPGSDELNLEKIDADTTVAGLDSFHFLGANAFDGEAGALHTVYDSIEDVTTVEGDTNGDSVADFGIDLAGNLTLAAGDFTTNSLLHGVLLSGNSSANTLSGGPLNDTLLGFGGNDTLSGNGGDDLLDGGAARDRLIGGAGDDVLLGGDGDDSLNGQAGNDDMYGGSGNDTYYVNSSRDMVTEDANGGIDLVNSSIRFTLPQNVENLVLTEGADLIGIGNELQNSVTGNTGNDLLRGEGDSDVLIGGDGNDRLIGSASRDVLDGGLGNDSLNGGGGADTMTGGKGDDVYYVDNDRDRVIEDPNSGTDRIISTITHTLESNVENLNLSGTADVNATGNSLNNRIFGNAGDNVLTGGAGNDTMTGGGGRDTFVYHTANDFGSSGDTITDFATGPSGSVLDFHDVLDQVPGYDSAHAFSAGYLNFAAVGGNTIVQIDVDGGGDSFRTMVTLQGVTLLQTDTSNYVA